jgi:hypothetical protein
VLGAIFSKLSPETSPVEASKEMLRILQGSEENRFEEIPTGDESRYQSFYPSSKMSA